MGDSVHARDRGLQKQQVMEWLCRGCQGHQEVVVAGKDGVTVRR